MKPADNPEYVKSELDAARMELLEDEYATEFEGLMGATESSLFAKVKPRHLTHITRNRYENCVWVLGIDQGPKNFAACLLGYDGKTVHVAWEYFEIDSQTMQQHLEYLGQTIPGVIGGLGGDPSSWRLTIVDADPPMWNEFEQLEEIGRPWKTEIVTRPKDQKGQYNQENWRAETYEFLNMLANPVDPNLLFDVQRCDMLHDQVMNAQIKAENREVESGRTQGKGWVIADMMGRGDHVVDAFVLGLFTIMSGQVLREHEKPVIGDPWEEAQKAFQYQLAAQERKEMSGWDTSLQKPHDDDIFQQQFGRPRHGGPSVPHKGGWHYDDA